MNIHFYKDIYNDIFKNQDKLDPTVYHEFLAKQLILRDYLAIERTSLTNQSTFLAYIRTSLTMMVVGITLYKLSVGNMTFQKIGVILTIVGFLIIVVGSLRTIQMRNRINKFLEKRKEAEITL